MLITSFISSAFPMGMNCYQLVRVLHIGIWNSPGQSQVHRSGKTPDLAPSEMKKALAISYIITVRAKALNKVRPEGLINLLNRISKKSK